jgi:transposase-like protein
MNVTDLKTKMHMQEWAKLIETRQDSGLSIKEWCRQNNLHESQYYYYLKKLRLAACEAFPSEPQDGAQFALVPKQARASNPIITGASSIKITLSNAVVEIGEGANEAQVRFTLEVLLNAQ